MDVIDLSHTIHDDMQIFPGDPAPSIRPGLTHEANCCHVDALRLGSHTGTHMDVPYHLFKDGARIDEIPVGRCVGNGVLIDVSAKSENEMIARDCIEPYAGEIRKGDFAIFRTGWDAYFGSAKYLRHPFLSVDAARLLLHLGVSLVGIDALNVDPSAPEPGQAATDGDPVHRILLGHNGLIVENLCSLDRIKKVRGLYSFLPLKLKDSDGSPIRAVFMAP